MSSPKLVFIGFQVRRVEICPQWLRDFGGNTSVVEEICSISDCISNRPEAWIDRWDFNAAWCYNTEEQAVATTPDGQREQYELFAYRMLPIEFDQGKTR